MNRYQKKYCYRIEKKRLSDEIVAIPFNKKLMKSYLMYFYREELSSNKNVRLDDLLVYVQNYRITY